MEINIGGTKIDFDFGENGETNGFNAWRLSEFVHDNGIDTTLNTEGKITSAINNAINAGVIVKAAGVGTNYYVNS